MLETVIDYSIFEDFTKKQPAQVPIGTIEDNQFWISFIKYLKEGSNVVLTNYKNQYNIYINCLTTGRKKTRFSSEKKFNKPHKFKFPKNQNIQTVFFLDEKSEDNQKKYKSKNGFLFGFLNDYIQVWKNLTLFDKFKVLPVRKNVKINFNSWSKLSDYILPFTDLIISDSYMFDKTKWDCNLFKIIKIFSKKTNIKFNLLLLSFDMKKEITSFCNIEKEIKDKLKELKISCTLSIVLAPQKLKEHDRKILSNYQEIKSGDSFNYFNVNNNIATHGTDIEFHPLSDPANFNSADAALKDIKTIINEIRNRSDSEKRIFGNLTNKLIN